jgi:hypothetical protein
MASSALSPPSAPSNSRPGGIGRAFTAPDKMAVNGHFASAGQNGKANFEHGIQVIDEDKEFKFDSSTYFSVTGMNGILALTFFTVQIFRNTYNLHVSLPPASIIT